MTTALDSVDAMVSFVKKYFNNDLKPYFNGEYLNICLNMISTVIGRNEFSYVFTTVSLHEPIWFRNSDVILISVPMIQHLLDRPFVEKKKDVEHVKNFNIFEKFQLKHNIAVRKEKNYNLMDNYSFVTREEEKTGKRKRNPDTDTDDDDVEKVESDRYCSLNQNNIQVEWNTMSGYSSTEPITKTQMVTLMILFRLAICVEHWLQHYNSINKFQSLTNHDNFTNILNGITNNCTNVQLEKPIEKKKKKKNKKLYV